MTATNHVITGAVIGGTITNPVIALPAALASHLLLDALPHYGSKNSTDRSFFFVLGGDASLAMIILLMIFIAQPSYWLLMISAGILAASPDLLWVRYWIAELRGQLKTRTTLDNFLSRIQWAETSSRWGWVCEGTYFVIGLCFLVPALSR